MNVSLSSNNMVHVRKVLAVVVLAELVCLSNTTATYRCYMYVLGSYLTQCSRSLLLCPSSPVPPSPLMLLAIILNTVGFVLVGLHEISLK